MQPGALPYKCSVGEHDASECCACAMCAAGAQRGDMMHPNAAHAQCMQRKPGAGACSCLKLPENA